jgi:hypothetical protein
MPDISELLRLGMMNRQAPMQAVDQLGTTLSGIISDRGRNSFAQQATKYFMDAEAVTPDAIKQFMGYYPNVDPQEVLKIAGGVASQKKAQRIKDLGSTIMKIAAENGGTLPEDKFADIFKNANGEDLQEVMTVMREFKRAHPEVKWEKLSQGETAHQTIGGKPTGQTLKGEAKTEEREERKLVGFDKSGRAVYTTKYGSTIYEDGMPYTGGPVRPTTREDKLLTPEELEQQRSIRKAGKTDVSVTNTIGDKGMIKLAEKQAGSLMETREAAVLAKTSLNNISEAEKLIAGGIITGTGAEFLVNAGNFLSSRLGVNLAKTPVENTQAYAATMGNQVGQIIKQFGSGTGLSDADREYAEKIAGGKITLTQGALTKLLGINKRVNIAKIREYNKIAKEAMSRPGSDQLLYNLEVDAGVEGKPQAQSGPKIGEVRKGYRFKGGDPANKNSWEKM